MGAYSLSHLSDQTLLRDLATLVARDRATTAELLAHLAEVEERRLYAVTGHPSMQAYCVYELHLSEDSARKRIHAAHAARRVPAIYPALAEGRLHLSGVILLAPWLSQENSDELIGAATHKTKFEIEELIVACFPRLDAPSMVQAISASSRVTSSGQKCAPGRIDSSEGAPRESSEPPPRIEPIAPERYVFQATIERRVHDKLRYAQELLSHKIPSGDLAKILECALDAVIREQEKRQFAATDRPRHGNRATSENPRHTPAEVRRAVRERDQRQCTFVSEAGRRCSSRRQLEFDHIIPVARAEGRRRSRICGFVVGRTINWPPSKSSEPSS